jgi:hypothetical protein
MPIFIWNVTFSVKPGLSKSEKIGDYSFEVGSDGATTVKRTYETIEKCYEIEDQREIDENLARKNTENMVLQDAEKIRELLLKRMIYQRSFAPITVEPQAPILTNKDELEQSGIKLGRGVFREILAKWRLLDVGDTFLESEDFWQSGFQGKGANQQDEIIRIADWLERSESEQDDLKGFILAWIGFNGLYGLFAPLHDAHIRSILKKKKDDKISESNKFSSLIKELIKKDDAEHTVRKIKTQIHTLGTYGITKKEKKKEIHLSDELNKAASSSSIDHTKVLTLVTECIYVIRNQTFHEAPRTDDILERARTARSALIPIASMCLKAFVTH